MAKNHLEIPSFLTDFEYGGPWKLDHPDGRPGTRENRGKKIEDAIEVAKKNWKNLKPAEGGNRSDHVDVAMAALEQPAISHLESTKQYPKILRVMPPPVWSDVNRVAREFGRIKPEIRVSGTCLYTKAKELLKMLYAKMSEADWADDADIHIDSSAVDPSILIAIWIYGREQKGRSVFGEWPDVILNHLQATGLGFLVVHKSHRRVPKCWKKWAKRNNIDFERHNVVALGRAPPQQRQHRDQADQAQQPLAGSELEAERPAFHKLDTIKKKMYENARQMGALQTNIFNWATEIEEIQEAVFPRRRVVDIARDIEKIKNDISFLRRQHGEGDDGRDSEHSNESGDGAEEEQEDAQQSRTSRKRRLGADSQNSAPAPEAAANTSIQSQSGHTPRAYKRLRLGDIYRLRGG